MDFVLGGTLLVCCAMLWGFAAVTLYFMERLRDRVEYLELLMGVQHEDDDDF